MPWWGWVLAGIGTLVFVAVSVFVIFVLLMSTDE
jgi:hypothetical protein